MFLLRARFAMHGFNSVKYLTNAGFDGERHELLKSWSTSEDNLPLGLSQILNNLSKIFKTYQKRKARELRHRLNAGSLDLTPCEVLQLVLEPVLDGVNAKAVAEALLKKFRTFRDVVNAPADRLMAVHGMNELGAAALKTVGVAATHMLRQPVGDVETSCVSKPVGDVKIPCVSKVVIDYVTALLFHESTEISIVVYLDARHRLMKLEERPHRTTDDVPFDPQEVVRRCLWLGAAAILIAYKPSGSPQAAQRDIKITEDLVNATAAFGITVMEHVVVDRDESFSIRKPDLLR